MREDYLWDRSGEPDPEILRLEGSLGQLRWRETGLSFVSTRPPTTEARRRWMWAAAAAAVVLALGVSFAMRRTQIIGSVTSWRLSVAGQKASAIRIGQTVETRARYATVESELVGRVDVQPNSRLRFLSARGSEQRFALDRGTIHALIWAAPTQFVVDTPSAKAVDLGCQYTLQVGDDGGGLLTVESGWVAFQWHRLESFIPAGAACRTRLGHGPDTPYFLDAPEQLTKAVRQFDLTGDTGALRIALSAARQRDALTLWHLLLRTQGIQRGEVFDRFAALVTVPQGVERPAILRGDQDAIDAAWNALDLGETNWWRTWKRQW
jgi:hypothetical protein